jgi:hypothetical protein
LLSTALLRVALTPLTLYVRVVLQDMHKTHSTEYLLESLVEGESLDGVLTSLIVIAEKKAKSQYSNKVTVKQWSRTARRLKELREWCAKFGPGSDCR